MWPKSVDWKLIRFGVEIEFVEANPESVELLPGWEMSPEERQIDETGKESGGELKTPPLYWEEREQIRVMLDRLVRRGAKANWSCGLHVHVDLAAWGEPIVEPLLDAALASQHAMRSLLGTSGHRFLYVPPVTEEMRRRYAAERTESAMHNPGRPQSHRCGINARPWFDIGTVEIRYANGSLDYDEIVRTVELYLRFVAAVGAGHRLPGDSAGLAGALGAATCGYPPPTPCPQWYKERMWLEEALIPVLSPQTELLEPGGEIHHIIPVPGRLHVAVEKPDGTLRVFAFRPTASGWELLEEVAAAG